MKKTDKDQVLVIAAGITLSQAVPAVEKLAEKGINARLMDPFTIKPIDAEGILSNAKECGGRILVVEDHYPEVRFVNKAFLFFKTKLALFRKILLL